MNQPSQNNGKEGRQGAKPKTDDSLLLLAMTILLIVAQTWIYELRKPQAAKARVIISGTQADALQAAVAQDLPMLRQNFEDYIKGLMFLRSSTAKVDEKIKIVTAQKDQFTGMAWNAYQSYVKSYEKLLTGERSLMVEFISGTQKYVDQGNDYKEFTAQGVYCYGLAAHYKCGTERFVLRTVVHGNLAAPAGLVIEEWSLTSLASAAPPLSP